MSKLTYKNYFESDILLKIHSIFGDYLSFIMSIPNVSEVANENLKRTFGLEQTNIPEEKLAYSKSKDFIDKHVIIELFHALKENWHDIEICLSFIKKSPRRKNIQRIEILKIFIEIYANYVYFFMEKSERLLKHIATITNKKYDISRYIKQYRKAFSKEITTRGQAAHNSNFKDVGISSTRTSELLVFLDPLFGELGRLKYKETKDLWAKRICQTLDTLLNIQEQLAEILLKDVIETNIIKFTSTL